MKYIKTYESFNVNETMDMFTLPVDPIAASYDVYKEIGQFIKEKMTDLVKYLGDKYNQFIEKFEEMCDIIADAIEGAGDKVQANLEKMFPNVVLTTVNVPDVKEVILDKFGDQLEQAIRNERQNEGYYIPFMATKKEIHREQEAGGDTIGPLPKDSGIVQTFLAILQNILGINLYACGVPAAFLISLIFGSLGMTAVVSMIISLIGGIIALFVVAAARQLVYNLEHGK